jgi:hypothetical protein
MNPTVSILIGRDETKLHQASVYLGVAMQRYNVDGQTEFEERPRGRCMVATLSGEHAEAAAQYLQNMATSKGLFAISFVVPRNLDASDAEDSHHAGPEAPGTTR